MLLQDRARTWDGKRLLFITKGKSVFCIAFNMKKEEKFHSGNMPVAETKFEELLEVARSMHIVKFKYP